jgi:ribonuclease HI
MPEFTCQTCQSLFPIPQTSLDKYPGWTPRTCRKCKSATTENAGSSAPTTRAAKPQRSSGGAAREDNLTVAEVLARYTEGPQTGVFTDGASHPNPGPGGWGAVYVHDGQIVAEAFGQDPDTTNNRMELTALIKGFDLIPPGTPCEMWTDSNLCVQTANVWAKGWEKNGWKRKGGEIKNLGLVKELYAKAKARPEVKLRWIAAHSGYRWNEYADALSTAYRRATK